MPTKIPFSIVKKHAENLGYQVVDTDNNYSNSKIPIKLICKCGNYTEKTYNFLRGKSSASCKKCAPEKRRQTSLLKYGVENISQLNSVKIKKKMTCLQNYGVESPLMCELVKDKLKKTVMEKYGVDNVSKAENIKKKLGLKWTEQRRQKYEKTCIKKYGMPYCLGSEHVREKIRNTMLARYNVMYPGSIHGHWEKAKKTWKEKYGIDHPLHLPEFMAKNICSHFSVRKYIFPRGKIVNILGYENFALDDLIKQGYDEDDIFTSPKDMPRVTYYFGNKTRKYYPDIYIKSENKFIEVKSTWTLKKEYEQIKAKFNAVKKQNIDLRCYSSKGEILELWFKVRPS